MDWEAQDEGFLAKIILQAGSKDIPVGTPVAVVVEEEEHVRPFCSCPMPCLPDLPRTSPPCRRCFARFQVGMQFYDCPQRFPPMDPIKREIKDGMDERHAPACMQVAAFKDYKPGESGGSSSGSAPAAAADAEPEPEPAEEGEEEEPAAEGGSGGGGAFPPHTVMGLPALSPTMSQGARACGMLQALRGAITVGSC